MFSLFGSSSAAKEEAPRPAAAPAPAPAPRLAPAPQQRPAPALAPQPAAALADPPASSLLSQRSLRQLGFFFAGAGFLTFSTLVTRRAVARRQLAAMPKFYQPSHRPAAKAENGDGPLIALEALNLATLNVVSFFMMLTGGSMWAFDISGIDDLRRMARRHIGPAGGRTEEEAEQEIEEWVAKVLHRKEVREMEGASRTRKSE